MANMMIDPIMTNTNESDIQIFGKFVETKPIQEQLAIVINPYAIPFSQRWGNNSISADYVGMFASKMFIDHPSAFGNEFWLKDIQSSVSFVANELLENAIKYSHYSYKYPIQLRICVENTLVRLLITNTATQIAAKKLQEFVKRVESIDTMELYLNQLEHGEIQTNSSGLGFLTIINDYSGQIGWKFKNIKQDVSNVVEVTTMVDLKFL